MFTGFWGTVGAAGSTIGISSSAPRVPFKIPLKTPIELRPGWVANSSLALIINAVGWALGSKVVVITLFDSSGFVGVLDARNELRVPEALVRYAVAPLALNANQRVPFPTFTRASSESPEKSTRDARPG